MSCRTIKPIHTSHFTPSTITITAIELWQSTNNTHKPYTTNYFWHYFWRRVKFFNSCIIESGIDLEYVLRSKSVYFTFLDITQNRMNSYDLPYGYNFDLIILILKGRLVFRMIYCDGNSVTKTIMFIFFLQLFLLIFNFRNYCNFKRFPSNTRKFGFTVVMIFYEIVDLIWRYLLDRYCKNIDWTSKVSELSPWKTIWII